MSLFLQLFLNGLINGMLYVLLALGFGLVFRTMRIFHIAYGGLYIASAYLFYTFAEILGLPVVVAVALTSVGATTMGYLMERGLYRPFFTKGASAGVTMMASLGLFVIIENAIALGFGNEIKTVSRSIAGSWRFGSLLLTRVQVAECVVGLATTALFVVAAKRMRIFKVIRAMGDEPELIPILGLPLFRIRSFVFMLSAVLVSLPACLITLDVGVDPHMGMSYMLIAAVAVLAGGMEHFYGWIVGAVVLAVLQSLAVWKFSSQWVDLVTFSLLVVMLLFKPHGLMGQSGRVEERT